MNRELFHSHILASMTIFMFYSIPTTCTNVSSWWLRRKKNRFLFLQKSCSVTGFLGGRKKSCNILFSPAIMNRHGGRERTQSLQTVWGRGDLASPFLSATLFADHSFLFSKKQTSQSCWLTCIFYTDILHNWNSTFILLPLPICVSQQREFMLSTYEMNTKRMKRWFGKGTK